MKRVTCLLCAVILLALSACGSAESVQSPTPSPSPSDAPQVTVSPDPSPTPTPTASVEVTDTPEPADGPINPLTGEVTDKDISNQKPVAIMLNNAKPAMPQQGNSQADILYEVLAEGGVTRTLGIYQDISDLGVVGSIRSARLYFWELALGHDAVFVHAGGSEEFYDHKSSSGLSSVDGVRGYYSYASTGLFWRDSQRVSGKQYAYEHSLVTDGEHLTDILTSRGELGNHADGYSNELQFAADATPADGTSAVTITAPFSSTKSTLFRYDEATGLYKVEQYGAAYIDGNDSSQIAVTNVLLLNTECVVMDSEGRLSVDLSSGEGWFACGGKMLPITWEKGDRDHPLRYYTADGQPLTLGIGKSYVCILPLSRTVTAE